MSPHGYNFYRNPQGMALVLVLVLLGVLTVIGTTAVTLTSTDLLVGANYKASQQAFYAAEAGVQYTLGRIPAALSSHTLHLDGTTVSEPFALTAPSRFAFELSPTATFNRIANTHNYYFRVTGRSHAASLISSTLEIVLRRPTLLPYGIFGDVQVKLLPGGSVYSYNSETTPIPTSGTSTGEADVGSNGLFNANFNPHIDGDVALGDDGAGTEGTLIYTGTPTITGQSGLDVPRVNPDPLGASGGELANRIATHSISNDNALAGIAGNILNLASGDTMTLTAGTYYLESLTLSPGSTLTIDSSTGEVVIYLAGRLDALPGSYLQFTGQPTGFTIYANSTEPITLQHLGVFKGTVYAPFATVAMKQMALPFFYPITYGLVWAREVDMIVDISGGKFYFDTALKNKFKSDRVTLLSWKELQH